MRRMRNIIAACKRTLVPASIFPLLLLLLLCFFDGWFSHYRMLGMGKRFLPIVLFLVLHFFSHFIIGINFFCVGTCPCLRERVYNSRLISLCHCFFSHIWFLLLLVAVSPFVSLFCGLAVLCFACLGCLSFFRIHPLLFLLGVLNAIWSLMLFFSNLGVLFC